ncbi:MAG: hypothetical protein RLO21_18335, partial [Nitratireductor sp.]
EKIDQIENSLDDAQEEGDDIDETDVYKFKVFKAQFGIQKAEVDESFWTGPGADVKRRASVPRLSGRASRKG